MFDPFESLGEEVDRWLMVYESSARSLQVINGPMPLHYRAGPQRDRIRYGTPRIGWLRIRPRLSDTEFVLGAAQLPTTWIHLAPRGRR